MIIGIFFLLLWLLKNIIVSGCAIYPIKITCISGIKWSTINNQTINTENAHIEIEAWSKGYPDQKEYNQRDFIKEFTNNETRIICSYCYSSFIKNAIRN